jgi:hypothetical protein
MLGNLGKKFFGEISEHKKIKSAKKASNVHKSGKVFPDVDLSTGK